MKFKILGLAFFLIFSLILTVSLAQEPGWPHGFYGDVTFTNGPAMDGLDVVAKIGDEEFGSTTTSGGSYGPYLNVRDPYQNNDKKTITFYVYGIKANEEDLWLILHPIHRLLRKQYLHPPYSCCS